MGSFTPVSLSGTLILTLNEARYVSQLTDGDVVPRVGCGRG